MNTSAQCISAKRVCSGVAEHLAKGIDGSYFIAGDISQTINIGKGPNYLYLNGSWPMDVFVAKLDSNFNPIWAKLGDSYDGRLHGLELDGYGNVFIAGTMGTYLVLDGQYIQGTGNNMFLAKITSVGVLAWLKYSTTQATTSVQNECFALAVDRQGNSYVTGTIYDDTTSFDSFTITEPGSPYLIKYDGNGSLQWGLSSSLVASDAGKQIGAGKSLCLYNNSVYLTGYSGNFSQYGFITKVSSGQVTSVNEIALPVSNEVCIFPNPTNGVVNVNYHLQQNQLVTTAVFNSEGRTFFLQNQIESEGDHAHQIHLDKLPRGIYTISVRGATILETKTVILE